MVKKLLSPLALAGAFALAACGSSEPEVLDSRAPDPLAAEKAAAGPVELPPAIRASATFRCADNSLVYVDFFQGDMMANFRTEQGGTPTQLTAPAAGEPLTGGDVTLTGTAERITLTQPGKGEQVCNA